MLNNKNNFISLLYMRKSIKLISRSKGTRRTRRKRLSPPKRRNRSTRREKVYKRYYQRGGVEGDGDPNTNEDDNEREDEDAQNAPEGDKCVEETAAQTKKNEELQAHNDYLIVHIMEIYAKLALLNKIDIRGQGGDNAGSANALSGGSRYLQYGGSGPFKFVKGEDSISAIKAEDGSINININVTVSDGAEVPKVATINVSESESENPIDFSFEPAQGEDSQKGTLTGTFPNPEGGNLPQSITLSSDQVEGLLDEAVTVNEAENPDEPAAATGTKGAGAGNGGANEPDAGATGAGAGTGGADAGVTNENLEAAANAAGAKKGAKKPSDQVLSQANSTTAVSQYPNVASAFQNFGGRDIVYGEVTNLKSKVDFSEDSPINQFREQAETLQSAIQKLNENTQQIYKVLSEVSSIVTSGEIVPPEKMIQELNRAGAGETNPDEMGPNAPPPSEPTTPPQPPPPPEPTPAAAAGDGSEAQSEEVTTAVNSLPQSSSSIDIGNTKQSGVGDNAQNVQNLLKIMTVASDKLYPNLKAEQGGGYFKSQKGGSGQQFTNEQIRQFLEVPIKKLDDGLVNDLASKIKDSTVDLMEYLNSKKINLDEIIAPIQQKLKITSLNLENLLGVFYAITMLVFASFSSSIKGFTWCAGIAKNMFMYKMKPMIEAISKLNPGDLDTLFKKIIKCTKSKMPLNELTPKIFTYLFFFIAVNKRQSELETLLQGIDSVEPDPTVESDLTAKEDNSLCGLTISLLTEIKDMVEGNEQDEPAEPDAEDYNTNGKIGELIVETGNESLLSEIIKEIDKQEGEGNTTVSTALKEYTIGPSEQLKEIIKTLAGLQPADAAADALPVTADQIVEALGASVSAAAEGENTKAAATGENPKIINVTSNGTNVTLTLEKVVTQNFKVKIKKTGDATEEPEQTVNISEDKKQGTFELTDPDGGEAVEYEILENDNVYTLKSDMTKTFTIQGAAANEPVAAEPAAAQSDSPVKVFALVLIKKQGDERNNYKLDITSKPTIEGKMPNKITITTEAEAEADQEIVLTKVEGEAEGEAENIYSTAQPESLEDTGQPPKKIISITTGDPEINIQDNGEGASLAVNIVN